jgi:tripartite-type tricarboxylate transporter receptor subunit TctC
MVTRASAASVSRWLRAPAGTTATSRPIADGGATAGRLVAAGSTGACLSAEARSTGGMPMTPRRLLWPFVVLLAAIIPASAQDWPSKTVTVVVPFTPAGSTDLLARIAAQVWEQRVGKPFLVENRPGGGQQVGVNAVAKAAPDGHTLLMATSSAMAVNPTLYKKLAYDPVKDFQPIAMMAHLPFILVVNPALPINSVADLIKYAKENPGKLSFGSGGVGASHHLYGEMFKSLTGVQMTHVPYRGTVPALNDVIAGHIPLLFSDPPPALPQIAAGKVRAIGVTTAKRIASLPNVPPIGDTVKGFDTAPWQMLMAPAGTPRPIIDRLHGEIVRYIASPEGQNKLVNEMGLIPGAPTSPDELAKFVAKEVEDWGKLVRLAGAEGIE